MTRRRLGHARDGATVEAVGIASGRLKADFMTLGARLNGLWFDGAGSLTPIIGIAEAEGDGLYTGAVISPVLNRLTRAQAPLDGEMLAFEPNEGPTLLHSGAEGSAAMVWEIESLSDDRAVFRLNQAAGAFPGNRTTRAAYALADDRMTLEITVTTDAPTLVNAGFHPYWTLSGQGREGHRLTIAADRVLPMHADKTPTGDIAAVTGTALDYRRARAPGFDIDHCFVFAAQDPGRVNLRLEGGGLALDVRTDAPACHVFTGNPCGIAIEPEIHPDAPNHPAFPSIRLAPGDVFRQVTTYRFSRL